MKAKDAEIREKIETVKRYPGQYDTISLALDLQALLDDKAGLVKMLKEYAGHKWDHPGGYGCPCGWDQAQAALKGVDGE